jgi:hypothetical protein
MRPHVSQPSGLLHRFSGRRHGGRQHKMLPDWAGPILKYAVMASLTLICMWLAKVSLF